MDQAFTVVPLATSQIIHSKLSTFTTDGFQANIFIDKPTPVEYDFVQPNSVYLITAKKNCPFEPFLESHEKAVVISIPMYINLLEFFKSTWPKVKERMEKQFKKIRQGTMPIEVEPHIQFMLEASVCYESWINDAFLYFKKSSADFSPNTIHLQRDDKSILVNAEVMNELSQSAESLVDFLYRAGFIDGIPDLSSQS
jgi:hypothetical protein